MKRYDVDGNECDLLTLCRRDPNWAASRIQHMEQQLVEASADKAKLVKLKALLDSYGCDCEDKDLYEYEDSWSPCFACRVAGCLGMEALSKENEMTKTAVLEGQIRHIVALIQENGCNCNEGDCELCLACRIALELE